MNGSNENKGHGRFRAYLEASRITGTYWADWIYGVYEKEFQANSRGFGLSYWKDGVVINQDGKTMRGAGFGETMGACLL